MATVQITNILNGDTLGPTFTVYGDFTTGFGEVQIKCELYKDGTTFVASQTDTAPDTTNLYWQVSFDVSASAPMSNCKLLPLISTDGGGTFTPGTAVTGLTITSTQGPVVGIDAPARFFGSLLRRLGIAWLLRVLGSPWPTSHPPVRKKYVAKGWCKRDDSQVTKFVSKITVRKVVKDTRTKANGDTEIRAQRWILKTGREHDLSSIPVGTDLIHEIRVTADKEYYANLVLTRVRDT